MPRATRQSFQGRADLSDSHPALLEGGTDGGAGRDTSGLRSVINDSARSWSWSAKIIRIEATFGNLQFCTDSLKWPFIKGVLYA